MQPLPVPSQGKCRGRREQTTKKTKAVESPPPLPPLKVCALPGCSMDVDFTKTPFTLGSYPYQYCSRDCVNEAFMLKRAGHPFHKSDEELGLCSPINQELTVEVPANDFGGAKLVRHYCDNPACRKQITVSWRGRDGIYCSNVCLKIIEKKEEMTTEENNPVTAGAPATKKATAKKAAPATKKAAAKKSAESNGAGKYTRTQAIVETIIDFRTKAGSKLPIAKFAANVDKEKLCDAADAKYAKKGGTANTKETLFHQRYVLNVLEALAEN